LRAPEWVLVPSGTCVCGIAKASNGEKEAVTRQMVLRSSGRGVGKVRGREMQKRVGMPEDAPALAVNH